MTEKELRKLNRKELLEILVSQASLIEELEMDLEKTKKELNDKNLRIKEAGSIAEASMKLSGIFEKAQEVADQYLNSIIENKDILVLESSSKKRKESKKSELKVEDKMISKIKKTRRRKIAA